MSSRIFGFRKLYDQKPFKLPFWEKQGLLDRVPRPEAFDILEWMNYYLSTESSGIEAPGTTRGKKFDLHKFLVFFQSAFTVPDIRQWDSQFSGTFIDEIQKEYSMAFCYRIFATLTNFSRLLVEHEVFPAIGNPTKGVSGRLPKKKLPPADGLRIETDEANTGEELIFKDSREMYALYMQACNCLIEENTEPDVSYKDRRFPLRDKAIIAILYHSGMRADEVCILTEAMKKRSIRNKGIWFNNVKCKGNRLRDIYLNAEATSLLNEYIVNERRPLILRLKTAYNKKRSLDTNLPPFMPPSPVFLSWRGNRLLQSDIWDIVRRITEKAEASLPEGVKLRAHPHSFRHERGYNLRASGLGDAFVAENLGHKDTSQVARYSRRSVEDQEDILESI